MTTSIIHLVGYVANGGKVRVLQKRFAEYSAAKAVCKLYAEKGRTAFTFSPVEKMEAARVVVTDLRAA